MSTRSAKRSAFARRSRARQVQRVMVVRPKRKRKRGPRLGALLKPKKMVKLRYVDTVSINPGAAAVAPHFFSANGIFDPDETGTGHQPLLHDTYALLYRNYRVVSSKIKVSSISSSLTNVNPAFWGVFTDENASLDYTLSTAIIEDKTRTKGYRQSISGAVSLQGNGRLTGPMTASFNSKRNLGKQFQVETTVFGANPSTAGALYHYIIWAGSVLGNDPGVIPFLVELEYVIELSDPINVAQS